ncbi:MAG: phytoene/squalene synthase family protein [Devosiaceae bacterium]|nr:phytoene/squalene synthase family protein [Devosiaceae bacterium MH13]
MGWNETACRALIRRGSKSFYAASLLLPQRVRKPAHALYAFCRLSDDAVDALDAPADAVARLRERLERVYAGRPADIPADKAFAEVVDTFSMPRALPEALLEGLEWDASGWRPKTLSDTYAYSARVAASVGAMMTVLMGRRDPNVLARACDLGVAMQLTNIARDVGEDARRGRTYIPTDWLVEAGLDPDAFVADPRFDPRVAGCTRRLLDIADQLYDRALGGIAGLPVDCRPAIHAARLIYREIGRQIEHEDYNSIDTRAYVSTQRKLGLLALAANNALWSGGAVEGPPLEENRFLVEAVPALGPARQGRLGADGERFDEGVVRIIELIEKLERRDRARIAAGQTSG